jgi:heme-binding NEAT domain protein
VYLKSNVKLEKHVSLASVWLVAQARKIAQDKMYAIEENVEIHVLLVKHVALIHYASLKTKKRSVTVLQDSLESQQLRKDALESLNDVLQTSLVPLVINA